MRLMRLVALSSIAIACFVAALVMSMITGLFSGGYLVFVGAESVNITVSKPKVALGGGLDLRSVKFRIVIEDGFKDFESLKEEMLKVAKSSDVFKRYVSEGYVVSGVAVDIKVRLDPSEKVMYIRNLPKGLVILKKGGNYVYLRVDLESGEVKVVER